MSTWISLGAVAVWLVLYELRMYALQRQITQLRKSIDVLATAMEKGIGLRGFSRHA